MINTIASNNVINLYELDFIVKDGKFQKCHFGHHLSTVILLLNKHKSNPGKPDQSVTGRPTHGALSWINTLHGFAKTYPM